MKVHLRNNEGKPGDLMCGKNAFESFSSNHVHDFQEKYFLEILEIWPDEICSKCLKKYHARESLKAS